MTTETPGNGGTGPCGWCGGPVPPSRGTKPRRYCKNGCKQRAYEARKLADQLQAVRDAEAEKRTAMLARAYAKGRAATSRDDGGSDQTTSRDVTQAPGEGWVRSVEEMDAQLAELEQRRRA